MTKGHLTSILQRFLLESSQYRTPSEITTYFYRAVNGMLINVIYKNSKVAFISMGPKGVVTLTTGRWANRAPYNEVVEAYNTFRDQLPTLLPGTVIAFQKGKNGIHHGYIRP